MTLEQKVRDALADLGVREDAQIGVACSGGADSIALLHLLAACGRRVIVLHVDHNVRAGSREDARFVAATAGAGGVRFRSRTVDPVGSSEAALRDARYAALSDMAGEANLAFVLTAHTLDDQAETVLLRLMRGDTLGSIAPKRGMFVRPLLGVRRAELRDWLNERGIAWRSDPTNDDENYERNWVRKTLLPMMASRRTGLEGVLARTATSARADNEALDALAAAIVSSARFDDAGLLLDDVDLIAPAIASRVVRMACRRLGRDPHAPEVEAIVSLERGHVRCGIVDVWRIGRSLAFFNDPIPVPAPLVLSQPGVVTSDEWGIRIDVGSLTGPLRIRSRMPGDRVRTTAGTKKVQDVLVDAKVPRPLRGLVPILADDSGALAVVGPGRVASPPAGIVLDVSAHAQTWSRERAWISRQER